MRVQASLVRSNADGRMRVSAPVSRIVRTIDLWIDLLQINANLESETIFWSILQLKVKANFVRFGWKSPAQGIWESNMQEV